MYRINLLEDEKNLNDLLTFHLQNEGWQIQSFIRGLDALEHINDDVDLWVLDIMVPDLDGYALIKKIKEVKDVPVIFISARDKDIDRVIGLEYGSDDYITKPFLPRELILRIEKLLSRNTSKDIINVNGCYTLDKKRRELLLDNEVIVLTSKEFDLVQVMIDSPRKAFSRDDLLNNVWGDDYFGSERVVDDLVRRIRKKLPNLKIETVYGYGYRWIE
ncbi:response regulator transcription factor [Clostridiaceae bacterium M8S5]|nr:response regulator transcription factor [Clostridiaceae bacterium M8S5]